ncbi:hypothetical protein EDB83DRAFT_2532681 [Lactarius deliciosus]|nr:hypothetical protein EDB83DRAFT_2532681 [Lactarius deliciosus]
MEVRCPPSPSLAVVFGPNASAYSQTGLHSPTLCAAPSLTPSPASKFYGSHAQSGESFRGSVQDMDCKETEPSPSLLLLLAKVDRFAEAPGDPMITDIHDTHVLSSYATTLSTQAILSLAAARKVSPRGLQTPPPLCESGISSFLSGVTTLRGYSLRLSLSAIYSTHASRRAASARGVDARPAKFRAPLSPLVRKFFTVGVEAAQIEEGDRAVALVFAQEDRAVPVLRLECARQFIELDPWSIDPGQPVVFVSMNYHELSPFRYDELLSPTLAIIFVLAALCFLSGKEVKAAKVGNLGLQDR